MTHPICYYVGHRDGKNFHYIAEVNTRELAEKVAEITGQEILSDNDGDDIERWIRDYGTETPARPVCPSSDVGCPHYAESGHCTLDDPAHECDDYMYYNGTGED